MVATPKQIANLIPAKPGEIRNPNGKPKGIPNAKTRYMRLLTLTEKMKNPVTGEMEEFSIMEQLDMQMIHKARKGDLNAYKEIMDRLEGRPHQTTDITSGGEKLPTVIIEGVYARDPEFRIDNSPTETDDMAKDSSE